MKKEIMLSTVGVIAVGIMMIGLLNMVIILIAPPSFDRFLKFGMTLPASVAATSNAAAIFLLAAVLRRNRN